MYSSSLRIFSFCWALVALDIMFVRVKANLGKVMERRQVVCSRDSSLGTSKRAIVTDHAWHVIIRVACHNVQRAAQRQSLTLISAWQLANFRTGGGLAFIRIASPPHTSPILSFRMLMMSKILVTICTFFEGFY